MSVYHGCAWYPQRPEEGVPSPGIGITDRCDPPCGCWESNLDPLEEQSMPLTSEPSLQDFNFCCFILYKFD